MGVQVGQAGPDRRAVRRHRLGRRRLVTQRAQRTDALRRGESQIEPGHPIATPGPPQPAAGRRVQAAGEQRLQLPLAHHGARFEPQLLQPPAVPAPRRLTHPQVVLTRPAGHPVGVVPPGGGADLRRAQHRLDPLGNPATRPRHRTFEECTCLQPRRLCLKKICGDREHADNSGGKRVGAVGYGQEWTMSYFWLPRAVATRRQG